MPENFLRSISKKSRQMLWCQLQKDLGLSTYQSVHRVPAAQVQTHVLQIWSQALKLIGQLADASLSVSAGFSKCFLRYHFGTAHGLGLVEKYCLLWRQASESGSDAPGCEGYAARLTDITPATSSDITSGSSLQKDLTSRVFPLFSQCTEFKLHRGFKLQSSRSGVRRSN